MTREDAHRGWLDISEFSLGECNELDRLINKIYDDFESRTCENCEHFYEPDLTKNITRCKLGYVSMFCGRSIDDGEVDKDFGCNKFERIRNV